MNAVAQSYLEICEELGCQPVQQFLQCLQTGSSRCQMGGGFDHEAQPYATGSLLQYAGITELDVSGLQLSSDGWAALLEGASKCTGLQALSIKGCCLGDSGIDVEKLASYIGACDVAMLDASCNSLGDDWLLCLCSTPLISHRTSRLASLNLSDNFFSDDGAVVLAKVLSVNGSHRQLKQVDLSFNRLEDRGVCALASMLGAVQLLVLELEGNQIGDVGSQALAAAVRNAPCLKRLNLNHNKHSNKTLLSMAEALCSSQSTLQELAVAGVGGDEEGMCKLLQAASTSRHVQLLDLRGVPLTSTQGVDMVCQLLASPAPLATLRLDAATREAAEAIAQALPHNKTLQHLLLGGPVPEHVLSFINAQLASNALCNTPQQQQQQQMGPSSYQRQAGTSPGQQQQQQNPWSPGRYGSYSGSPSKGSPGSSSRAWSPIGNKGQLTPPRPASAVLLGASSGSGAKRSVLVRSTTQQARRLSEIDMAGLGGLAGGGAANKAAEVFRRHDSDASGYLDAEEMMSALQDLGMLEGMKARQLGKFLSNAIREADVDQDGRVSLEEFCKYYERLARYYAEASRQGRICARRQPQVPLDAAADQELKKVFKANCRLRIGQGRQVGGSTQSINAAQFNQLCRDAGLLEPAGPLSQCAVDIVFTRCRAPGARRLAFKEFLQAVASVAEEAGCDFSAITHALCTQGMACSTGADGMTEEYNAQAGLLAAAAARGSMATAHTRLSISDLTDKRVGPELFRSSQGQSIKVLSMLTANSEHRACSSRSNCPIVPGKGPESYPSGAYQLAAADAQQQQLQEVHAEEGTVQNPLYEGELEVPGSSIKSRLLEQRMSALEQKLQPSFGGQEMGIAASAAPEEMLPRLLLLEASVADQQQQLSAIAVQQDALREVVGRLVESLEAANLQANTSTQAELHNLTKQVQFLTVQLQPLQEWKQATAERLQEVDDKQLRAETAIYQVARQVDVLDARLRDEQESSLKALEAILTHASPVKP